MVKRSCLACLAAFVLLLGEHRSTGADATTRPSLPAPQLKGRVSLEETLQRRRSVRAFADKALTPEQLGQLCWAADGVTDTETGHRTAPSAGALYPVDVFVVTPDAVRLYVPREHALQMHYSGDMQEELRRAGLSQDPIRQAPVCFVITAAIEKSAVKYHERAERYCFLEAGHIAQNILLQTVALDLGAVPIGGFDEKKVIAALRLPEDRRVLYLLPVGHPR